MTQTQILTEAQRGPAERLLDLVLRSGAHLWHNRPGLDLRGTWIAKSKKAAPAGAAAVAPGLHVPSALALYRQLLEIYRLNHELMAHFASYVLLETDWRDLKVATAALMLVQPHAGAPVRGDSGQVEFYDDDHRAVGEAMMLYYQKGSARMMSPKAVLRVAELLEQPELARLNREAGFGDLASRKAPLGRWKRAATLWLRAREHNVALLQGLAKAGFKETIKKLARKAGYRPESQLFFEVLGWKQKQSAAGHRQVGLVGLELQKSARFDGLGEAEICERIVQQKLSYKEAVGRLPKELGLTPAIMAALLPSLSDKDLRILTPTLESLGLLQDARVKARWSRALETATDQRALHIAKNVKSKQLRAELETAADHAVKGAVAAATKGEDLEVVFLIDKSGSMERAIDRSKDALSKILAGLPLERLHAAAFDTSGTVLKPKAASRAAVQHMLSGISAGGGTQHGAALQALHQSGFRLRPEAKLILIVAGDEDGEPGPSFANTLSALGLQPAAMALIVCVADNARRGRTVRDAAAVLKTPFSEIDVSLFDDPYQVPRALQAMLDAPVMVGAAVVAPSAWVEKVLKTPILQKPAA